MRHEITFFGHKNIRSLHEKTIEITKESHLTPQGDCIVGINSEIGCMGLPDEMKEKIRNKNSRIKFSIIIDDLQFDITGKGHPGLTLTHNEDIVLRKSDFICPRTIAIKCDKASNVIPRKMIELLQNPKIKGKMVIEVS